MSFKPSGYNSGMLQKLGKKTQIQIELTINIPLLYSKGPRWHFTMALASSLMMQCGIPWKHLDMSMETSSNPKLWIHISR
jgi:hypothetical protein